MHHQIDDINDTHIIMLCYHTACGVIHTDACGVIHTDACGVIHTDACGVIHTDAALQFMSFSTCVLHEHVYVIERNKPDVPIACAQHRSPLPVSIYASSA